MINEQSEGNHINDRGTDLDSTVDSVWSAHSNGSSNNIVSSEARCTPLGTVCVQKESTNEILSVNMEERTCANEARAPCSDHDRNWCINNNEGLQAYENANEFLEYTKDRQVRDGYNEVLFTRELKHYMPYRFESHYIGGVPIQLNPAAWIYELQFENDDYLKSYIRDGIQFGFDIVDSVEDISDYDSSNYPSVINGPSHDYVDQLINKELKTGKYLLVHHKPKCIHSLGAVIKADYTYRPITDCSQPRGLSVNNWMDTTHSSFVYNSVDSVSQMMRPGIYTATVDISAAYRTIPIKEEHRHSVEDRKSTIIFGRHALMFWCEMCALHIYPAGKFYCEMYESSWLPWYTELYR